MTATYLTDELLAELNGLVASGDEAGMRALKARFKEFEITGQQQLAADAGDTPRLAGHILLCDNSPEVSPLHISDRRVWRKLAGSGRHYNGMYGLPRSDGKITLLGDEVDFSDHRPAAPIGLQIALCIRVFGAGRILVRSPALARAVQRHFNDLLIAYPVLAHPAFMVPVHAEGTLEYTGVIHAVAASGFGSLPRANHYPRLAPELLLPHLAKLARHPCLQWGLGTAWHLPFDVKKGRIRRCRKGLVEHMLPVPTKSQFLGSAMEMQELAMGEGLDHDPAGSKSLPLPLLDPRGPVAPDYEDERKRVVTSIARSLFVACGAAPSAEALGREGDPDFDFLADVKKRRAAVLADEGFMDTIERSMIRALFSSNIEELSAQQVTQRTHAIINALVEAGLKPNLTASAQFVMEACFGRGRVILGNGNLPQAETATALGFLEVLDGYGAFGSMDTDSADTRGVCPARTLYENLLDMVAHYPSHQVPFRDQWTSALQAWWTAKAMRHQIASALERSQTDHQTSTPAASAGLVAAAAVPGVVAPVPPSGRRRLAV